MVVRILIGEEAAREDELSRESGIKHLGILATTPEGAALCFQAFCQEGFAALGPHEHTDVTLDCIALARYLPAWQQGDYAVVRDMLSVSARRLAAAGADFFACPDNTSHVALEQPGGDLALPGLHIAEVVADQGARDGYKRVAVLGTKYTMEGPVYPRALAAHGIARLRGCGRPASHADVARRAYRGANAGLAL